MEAPNGLKIRQNLLVFFFAQNGFMYKTLLLHKKVVWAIIVIYVMSRNFIQ